MRKTGIDDKMVFFVRRYSEPEIGSYFEYSVDKEVCNQRDSNIFSGTSDDNPCKFYLKIGGVTFLPKKPVPGKRISTSAERVKESKYFGSYVYYAETDKKIRCILYARLKSLPQMKLLGNPSCLHSIIPRYDGTHDGVVITGMSIYESNTSQRGWSRYDVKTKAHHNGFFEIDSNEDLHQVVNNIPPGERADQNVKTGFYVGANTSLLMVDVTRSHLYLDYSRDFVYTLFQEGAFICTNRPFSLCFYDHDEYEEYDYIRLKEEMKHKLKDTPNLDRLFEGEDSNRIFFLKSAPNYTFWTLRANKYRRAMQLEVMLCIPSDAQFENIFYWNEGLEEVIRRQSLNPWDKYTEQVKTFDSQLEEIDFDKNEPYPRMHSTNNLK